MTNDQPHPAADTLGESEQDRRHRFRNDLTSAAAQMQLAIEQVRETRALLLEMVRIDLAPHAPDGSVADPK